MLMGEVARVTPSPNFRVLGLACRLRFDIFTFALLQLFCSSLHQLRHIVVTILQFGRIRQNVVSLLVLPHSRRKESPALLATRESLPESVAIWSRAF